MVHRKAVNPTALLVGIGLLFTALSLPISLSGSLTEISPFYYWALYPTPYENIDAARVAAVGEADVGSYVSIRGHRSFNDEFFQKQINQIAAQDIAGREAAFSCLLAFVELDDADYALISGSYDAAGVYQSDETLTVSNASKCAQ